MLTVYCVLWGDKYSHYCVQRLQREVAKHLPIPHEFRCLSDQIIDGVDTIPQLSEKPGWWQKIDLLKFTGPSLYFDLDVVITGDLSVFVGTGADIRVLKNWAASGHGGCQSSIMYWENARAVPDNFDDSWAHWPPINTPGVYWGDQEVLTAFRDNGTIEVDYFDPAHALSYKYHCRNSTPPDTCRAVIFHGDPKPSSLKGVSWYRW